MLNAVAVAVAAVLEATIGEPPRSVHPVAWLGRLVGPVDRDWSRPRFVGMLVAIFVPLLSAAAVASIVALGAIVDPWLGTLLAGVALFVTTSLRMLLSEARGVVGRTDGDLARAREELLSLAGRDAADLSAGQVRSAAVESVAENLADGLVAPLAVFTVVGVLAAPLGPPVLGPAPTLALAAGAAAWVKSVNTLDSMLGYHSKPVGWAPARLDDLVMWLPARVSAALLALVGTDSSALSQTREWVAGVSSPNSGWPMGVLAATADVRLEKPSVYVLNPGATLPSIAAAREAIRSVKLAGILAYLLSAGTLALAEGFAWS